MPAPRPNLLLITTDQQRFDGVGINGSPFLHTPNMDRLAQEGVRFTRAYCPNGVCTPSRVSMMNGWHLSRHGSYNIGVHPLGTSEFLSTILRSNGYRTHHLGKAHWHPWEDPTSPEYPGLPPERFAQPFTDFAGFETAELCMGHAGYNYTGHYRHWLEWRGADPREFKIRYLSDDDPNGTGEYDLPVALHSGAWLAERAAAFLESHDRRQPFFLNVGFPDPHHPHLLPTEYRRRVDAAAVPPPRTDLGQERNPPPHLALFRDGTLQESDYRGPHEMAGQGWAAWESYWNGEGQSRATRAYYYGMVHLIDDQLGVILDALDALDLTEDTLVVYASDHGEMLGDHAIGQKGPLLFEEVLHIPLFFRYPAGFSPSVMEECVSLVDLLPTALDLAGIPDARRRDGISLKPRLSGLTDRLPRTGVRVEYKEEADRIRYKAWVTPEWKLAVYGDESWGELYGLADDPGEWNNHYDDPGLASVRERLLKEMLEDMARSEPLGERNVRV